MFDEENIFSKHFVVKKLRPKPSHRQTPYRKINCRTAVFIGATLTILQNQAEHREFRATQQPPLMQPRSTCVAKFLSFVLRCRAHIAKSSCCGNAFGFPRAACLAKHKHSPCYVFMGISVWSVSCHHYPMRRPRRQRRPRESPQEVLSQVFFLSRRSLVLCYKRALSAHLRKVDMPVPRFRVHW